MPQASFAGAMSLGQVLSTPIQPSRSSSGPVIRSARSRNRAAAWAHDLAQWREFQALSHPDRRDEIDAEYARLAAGGPDFTAYHARSSFAEAPAHQITREDRVRILAMFDCVRSGLYHHSRQKQGQAVSRNYRDVLGVLLSFAVKKGRVYPRLETIARAAMCSTRTVLRALAWLELFGFLARIRRLARVRTALGNTRVQQTSNAYRLVTRLSGLGQMALNVFSGRGRHNFDPSVDKGSAMKKAEGRQDLPFQFSSP